MLKFFKYNLYEITCLNEIIRMIKFPILKYTVSPQKTDVKPMAVTVKS